MGAFLEEELPIQVSLVGAIYGDEYSVEIVETGSGSEYRRLIHPFPLRHFTIQYKDYCQDLWEGLLALYHRSYGMFAGFRVEAIDDSSTGENNRPYSYNDHELFFISSGLYQLRKFYGNDGSASLDQIGFPYRLIFKPKEGHVSVGITNNYDTIIVPSTTWEVDILTGRVSFIDKTKTITGITKSGQAIITVGAHAYINGETVNISGVIGMTQINGKRGLIVSHDSTHITINIDSTDFSNYSSGGVLHTNPQSGEIVTGGCDFYIPCRFNSTINLSCLTSDIRETTQIDIIELLEP